VSTAVRERPAGSATGNGGIAARRAVTRWAWRLFRREWRQQILILILVAVAVAATILSAAVATNTPPSASAGFGTANHLVTLPGSDPHLAADIAAIRRQFGTVDVIESQSIATGAVNGIQLLAQDPHGPYGQPMLALTAGHYPAGPGQVAVTKAVASVYHLRIGSVWQQGGRARRVTGLVQNPQNLLSAFALVAPGQVTSPTQVTVLFDSARARITGLPAGVNAQAPEASTGGLSPALIVLAIAVLGLIFIGLVAVAGFTVMAQRRLRSLGMLAALGATDDNIRLVMLANGAVVGLAGTVLGAVIGFGAWIAYVPSLQNGAGHTIDAAHLPWLEIGAAMVLAVGTAIFAASQPARSAARVPVVTALAGRPAPPKASHRRAAPGIILLAVGAVLTATAGGWAANSGLDLLKLLSGLVAVTVGGLLLTPLLVSTAGRAGRHAPVAVRLALRDLARYRARSGAALSAISFAVMLAALIAIIAGARFSDVLDYVGPNLAPNELLLSSGCSGPTCPGPQSSGQNGTKTKVLKGQAAAQAPAKPPVSAIAAALGTHDVLTLTSVSASLYHQTTARNSNNFTGTLYVATPALLRHYGIQPSQVSRRADILTARAGMADVPDMQLLFGAGPGPDSGPAIGCGPGQCSTPTCTPSRCVAGPVIQTVSSLPDGTTDPNTLITTREVARLKLHPTVAGWLYQTARPLTQQQISTARQLAASAGVTIETKSSEPSLSQLRNWSTAGGVLLALGVLAMTVGLIRSETAGDLRTLSAAGASSTTRRTLTAATAGTLALLGALLGTALAYVVCLAWLHSSITTAGAINLTDVPWTDLTVIIVGMPLVATVVGWLAAGRQPPAIARQPST
jgi:putative ABC transport system permease protein